MDDHPPEEAIPIDSPLTGGSSGPRERLAGGESSRPVALSTRLKAALRDPVVWILLLAGIFDGISGNAIHSILLFAVAVVIAVDVRTGSAPTTRPPGAQGTRGADGRLHTAVVTGAAIYALLVGGFARYSWPATLMVVAAAAAGLALGWRMPGVTGELPPVDRAGAVAWVSVFVGLSLWELIALLLQPSLTTDSYAHPTLSVLTDPILASHPGRSIVLFLWLLFGWFLVQR